MTLKTIAIMFAGCDSSDKTTEGTNSETNTQTMELKAGGVSDPILEEEFEDQENGFLNLAGSWESEDGKIKFEIYGEGGVFKVEADYGDVGDHPVNFSFREYETYFEYKTRAYKVFFQGSNPRRIRLLWKGIDESGFKKAFRVYRVE